VIDGPDTSASVPAPTPTNATADDAAGGAPSVVPTPRPADAPTGPQKSAVELASERARAVLSSGKSNLDPEPAPPAKKPTGPAKPREPTTGKFKPSGDPSGSVGDSTRSAAFEKAAASANAEPEDGQGAPAGDPAEGEGTEPIEGKEPVEATAEGEPGAEGEGGDEEEQGFTVELPGRREGETLPLVVEDEETANTLRMLTNSFQRRQQLDAQQEQVSTMQRDYEELKDIIEADPAGFAIDSFASDPEAAERVALSLLTLPGVWERVQERVLKLDDPRELEVERLRIENQNAKSRESLRTQVEEQRAVSRNLKDVQLSVAALIPEGMADDEQGIFFRDALRDLKEYADRNKRMTIEVSDIPLILASTGRLKAHKIDPLTAAERITEARSNNRRPAAAGTKPPATSAPAPAVKKPAGSPPPPKTGKDMVKGSRAKRAAASSPSGAGSPTSAVTPPPNQTTAERIAWHRAQNVKGRQLSR
jgi:hypothetical protein